MSFEVALDQLGQAIESQAAGFLLTSRDGRVKVVSARVRVDDEALTVVEPGRGSSANIGTNPAVTLLFPPPEPGGYALLVDGDAELDRSGDARVTVSSAILHRPATELGATGHDGCAHDCRPLA